MERDFLKSVLAVRKLEAEVRQAVEQVRQAVQQSFTSHSSHSYPVLAPLSLHPLCNTESAW